MGAAAAAALLTPSTAASEDQASAVYVDQVQLGDVWAGIDVHFGDHAKGDVGASASAIGNTAAGSVEYGDITYSATQKTKGDTGAVSNIAGGDVSGAVYGTTTAYANASSGGSWAGNTSYRAEQSNAGDVVGVTNVAVRNVDRIGTTTTAIANVSTPSSEFGDNKAFSEQTNSGSSYCLLYTSPSPRDATLSRMPSSA